jgi:hypothetical protein
MTSGVVCSGTCLAQACCPVSDAGDLCLVCKHFLQQDLVHVGIGVQAAVRQGGEPVIQVGGLAHSGEHHAASDDASQHQMVDAAGAQQHVQIAAGEGRHTALVTITSPAAGAMAGWTREPGSPSVNRPVPTTAAKLLLRALTSGYPGRNASQVDALADDLRLGHSAAIGDLLNQREVVAVGVDISSP